MPKYIYWRGLAVWCSYPFNGYPKLWPMKIKALDNTKAEKRLRESQADEKLRQMMADVQRGELRKLGYIEYNPRYWRIVGDYWYKHLRFEKSGSSERYHLMASLKKFGPFNSKDITADDITLWMNEQKVEGKAVNTINRRFAYMKAAYKFANRSSLKNKKLNYNPTDDVSKMSGAKSRTFVLTKEKFERNYAYLKKEYPKFSLFYLALWDSTRRPKEEVSQYQWEWVNTIYKTFTKEDKTTYQKEFHIIQVPKEITKTDQHSVVIISERLWNELEKLPYRDGLIFRNTINRRWVDWKFYAKALKEKFGDDSGWIRDCRRGGITHSKQVLGLSDDVVMKQSGHKDRSVFDRYNITDLDNRLRGTE